MQDAWAQGAWDGAAVKVKHPTQKEKIEVYEKLLHDLQFYRCVAMREEAVMALLQRIDAWSYAHRAGNGEGGEKETQERVDAAFWRLSVKR